MSRLKRQMVAALQAHLGGARPRPPHAGVLLWEAFVSLSRGRRYDLGLPLALSGVEITGYVGLQGAAFGLDHIAVLEAMDQAWLKNARDRIKHPEKAAVPLTGAAFDAMFG